MEWNSWQKIMHSKPPPPFHPCVITGFYVLNLGKTWEKLMLAARIIVAIENPKVSYITRRRPWTKS